MVEPPRVPPDPDDETVIVPPTDDWGPESEVFVEESVTEPPPPKRPVLWPWLLALLVLVLAGLGAAYFLTRDDDDDATTTTSTARDDGGAGHRPGRRRHDVLRGDGHSSWRGARRESRLRAFRSVGRHGDRTESDGRRGGVGRLDREAERRRGREARSRDHRSATTTAPTTTAAPEPAVVPDVVGQELADAARAFSEEGLKVAVVYVPSNEPKGSVVAQARPPGAELQAGDTVQLNVSTGADPRPTCRSRMSQGRNRPTVGIS